MNRRKFLGVCAGVAVTGIAVAKTDRFCEVVVEPETIGFAPRHYPYQRLRWVTSDQLYDRMRAGWEEYRGLTAPISKLVSNHPPHNKIAHLMIYRG